MVVLTSGKEGAHREPAAEIDGRLTTGNHTGSPRRKDNPRTGNPLGISLEKAAQEFVDATSEPPFLYQLPPEEGRKAVDSVQDSPIDKPAIGEEWITVPGGPTGSMRARIVKPQGATGTLPVIVYTHGAGWVFGDAHDA